MADRYWVGGTGTWNTTSTTNWSASSGGSGGASVPTTADDVFFDQAATYTVTMTGALACRNITVSAGPVTFATGTTPTLTVAGSWSTVAGTVWNATGAVTFTATTSQTITSGGITISSPFTFNGTAGTWTLQDNLTFPTTVTTTLTLGTLALGSFTLSTGLFSSSNGNTRTINFGTGKIRLTSATTSTIWNTGSLSNLTISGTSLVECVTTGTGVTKTISAGVPSEANSINFSLLNTVSGTTYTFTGGNAIRNLIIDGVQTVSNIAISIFGAFTHTTVNGTTTFTAGTNAWTFAATSGSFTINNIAGFTYDFPWIFGNATSTATWTLANNLTLGGTRQLTLRNGSFDINSKTISAAGITILTGTPTLLNTGTGSFTTTLPFTHTSGSFTLPFNITTSSASGYTLAAGTLALGTFTLTTTIFSSSNSSSRTLNFGTGQLALTGNGVTIFNVGDIRNLTITGTFYVNCTYTGSVGTRTILWGSVAGSTEALAQNVSFSGTTGIVLSPSATDTIALTGGFNSIDFTGFTGTLSNTGRTIFGDLTVPASGGTFTAGINVTTFGGTGTETITTNGRTLDFPITFSGVGGTFVLAGALTLGSTRTVTLDSGTLNLNDFTLTAGFLDPSDTTTRVIAFGTTGQITLVGNGTTIVSMANMTNFTYTGTPRIYSTYSGSSGTRTFTFGSTDGATSTNIFDVSFGSSGTGIVITPATDTVALTGVYNNINFTGFTGTLSNTPRTILGDLTVPASGGTFTAGANVTTFAATSGTKTITSNGRTLDFPVTINGAGGTFQLQDNLTLGSTRAFTLTAGAFNLNNLTLSAESLSATGTVARSIAFGTTGLISLVENNGTVVNLTNMTNFTYTGTPRIYSTYTGATGTRTFNLGDTTATGVTTTNIFDFSILDELAADGGAGIGATGDDGGGGGGGIGGGVPTTVNVNGGYTGGVPFSINGLSTAVVGAGYTFGSGAGAAGGVATTPTNEINGGNATGFGAGGGGAGYYGGRGGNGYLGGGGGGAAGLSAARAGGDGGGGAIVIQMTVNGSPQYVVLTSGTTYDTPVGTTSVKIWAIGAGGGGAGVANLDGTSGGGGGAGGIDIITSTNTGTITYSIGAAGAGGVGATSGSTGGTTTATFDGKTATAYGGVGGGYNNSVGGAGGSTTPRGLIDFTGIGLNLRGQDTLSLIGSYNNFDLTRFTGTFGNSTRFIYGNFTIPSTGGSLSSGTSVTSFVGTGSKTLSTGGRTLDFPVTVNGAGGTFQLLGNFTIGSTRTFTLTAGTLDLNNFILSAATFSSNNGNVRIVAFGSTGLITLGGNSATIVDFTNMTNFTYTGTPKIYSTYTGATGTRTFNIGNAPATGATSTNVFDLSIGTSGDGLVISTGTDILALIGSFNNFNLTGLSQTINNNTRFIYGDFTIPASGGTLAAGTNVLSFVGGGTENITTNSRTLDFPITFNGAGTFRLQSALLQGSTRAFTHTNGTIDLNGYTLTVGTSYTTAAGTKNLTFNGGTLVCPTASATTFNNAVPAGFTTTAGTGTGTISLTAATAKTFVGGSVVYNCDIDNTGAGALTIAGLNTFNRIKSSYANTTANTSILLPAGSTTLTAGIVGGSSNTRLLALSPVANSRANVVISNASIQTASYVQANSIIFNASELQNPSSQTSVFFDGTGDYLSIANNSALQLGTESFTMEAWVYSTTSASQLSIFSKGTGASSGFTLFIFTDQTLRFTHGVSTTITSTSVVPLNTWTHVAAVRKSTASNEFDLYINGVSVATSTVATNFNQTNDFYIAAGRDGAGALTFNGYISNARIVKGAAVYTTNFTPPTSPLTAIANTSLLTCQSATLVDNGPNNFTITAVGNSSVSPFSPFDNFTNGTTPWRLYLANSVNNGDTLGAVFQEYSNSAPIVYYITSGNSFTVPADWDNSNNAIHIYGAGGGSSGSYVVSASGNRLGSAGGGGGGYTRVLNLTATPGSSLSYSIGSGGAAGAANNLSSGGNGGITTFASIYSANGGTGSSITSSTTTAGLGGTGATANGGAGGIGGGAAGQANNSSGGGGGGSGGPNGVGGTGGNGVIAATPSGTAGGGGGGSGGGTNGANAVGATPGTGGNNFIGTRSGGNGGVTTANGATFGTERGRASYDILNSIGGGGGGGGGGAYGPSVGDPLNIGGGAGGSGATDADFVQAGTAGQSGGIIILYYPTTIVISTSNMFMMFQ